MATDNSKVIGNGRPNFQELTEQRQKQIAIPASVGQVIAIHQESIWKAKATIAGARSLLEGSDGDGDVEFALLAAKEMLEAVAVNLDLVELRRAAACVEIRAEMEVANG